MTRRVSLLAAATLLLAGGCASAPRPCPSLGPPSLEVAWTSARHREHPLAGRIWDVRGQRRIDLPALEAALAEADLVLLGETHDNADHHLLQGRLVRALAARGRRPAVALEMLDADQQGAVDGALARAPRDADALGEAVRWARSGWPAFSLYRPVFTAALDAGLPIAATNLPRKQVERIVDGGTAALPPSLRALVEVPLAAGADADMRDEMRASHCGKLPEELLEPLALGQRARDAQMAERLVEAARRADGAVLIAGTGHVRTDRGVPWYLAHVVPGKKVLSLAFVEVAGDGCAPADYAEEYHARALPFDYVVFTPGAEREDPCKKMRQRVRPPPAEQGTPL